MFAITYIICFPSLNDKQDPQMESFIPGRNVTPYFSFSEFFQEPAKLAQIFNLGKASKTIFSFNNSSQVLNFPLRCHQLSLSPLLMIRLLTAQFCRKDYVNNVPVIHLCPSIYGLWAACDSNGRKLCLIFKVQHLPVFFIWESGRVVLSNLVLLYELLKSSTSAS